MNKSHAVIYLVLFVIAAGPEALAQSDHELLLTTRREGAEPELRLLDDRGAPTEMVPRMLDGAPAALRPDGLMVATITAASGVVLWDTKLVLPVWSSQDRLARPGSPGIAGPVAVRWSASGRRLAAAGAFDPTMEHTSIRVYAVDETKASLIGATTTPSDVALELVGDDLLVGRENGGVARWNPSEATTAWSTRVGRGGSVSGIALTPDGQSAVVTVDEWDGNGSAGYRLDVETGAVSARTLVHPRAEPWVVSAAYRPAGGILATTGADGFACWQDAETGARLECFGDGRGTVAAVAFSGDGRWMGAVWWDRPAVVVDVLSKRPAYTLSHGHPRVIGISLSRDGSRVVSYDRDVSYLWEPAQPNRLAR